MALTPFIVVGLGAVLIDNPRWVTVESDRPLAATTNATAIDAYAAGWEGERRVWRGVPYANGGNAWDRPGGVVRLELDPCGWYVVTAIDPRDEHVETAVVPSPVDYDGDYRLTSGDLFEFLRQWFGGQGDHNRDGATDSGDVFD